jgi:hypothetical protein
MKNKIVIQIFPMVNEIDYLERTLLFLKQSSVYLDKEKFYIILDVTLPTSHYLTDWDKSILKQDYFINKFKNLEKYASWCDEYYFNIDDKVKGCVDCCITNIYKYPEVDDMIWLDIDIIFNPYTLSLILESSLEIKKNQSKYIITPEYVKLWDGTWDTLVNDNFINQPYGYEKKNDPIVDTINTYGDISLEALGTYKWGGAWFTLYSKELLDYIQFPKDIEGYSPIDTFIMECCKYIPDATQYKIKNLVVAEDYKYINRELHSNYLKSINRKQDLFQMGWDKMINHLKNNILKR